jgi:hypothetical protein
MNQELHKDEGMAMVTSRTLTSQILLSLFLLLQFGYGNLVNYRILDDFATARTGNRGENKRKRDKGEIVVLLVLCPVLQPTILLDVRLVEE